jgi:hypothetical protein
MHVRAMAALSDRPLSPAQRRLVDRQMAGAELRLAQTLHATDAAAARGLLWRAARRHPSPIRGWGKSLLAASLGARGFRLLLRNKALDRS